MQITGKCYCGSVQYKADGDSAFKGQCHCRECQYISGGHPNVVIAMPEAGFSYTQGTPKSYSRSDLPNPVTRQFCGECGTHLLTRSPRMNGMVLIKVGSLDDPGVYDKPDMVIYTVDKQSFHHLPAGVPAFERVPG